MDLTRCESSGRPKGLRWNNLLRNCVPIPGMKHICDNLVNDVTKVLSKYKWFAYQ